jgi:hypothetical protein
MDDAFIMLITNKSNKAYALVITEQKQIMGWIQQKIIQIYIK